jgi:hypothetical protein
MKTTKIRSSARKAPVLHGITWRGQNRRGVADEKGSPAVGKDEILRQPTVCDHCGATYVRRTWRFDHPITSDLLERAIWDLCPACKQRRTGVAYGRVVLRGSFVAANEDKIRRRIANVAAYARHTHAQRRVLSMERDGKQMEVLTTSQRLAHRIVKELKKAFGGRARYVWDPADGALYATWTRQA